VWNVSSPFPHPRRHVRRLGRSSLHEHGKTSSSSSSPKKRTEVARQGPARQLIRVVTRPARSSPRQGPDRPSLLQDHACFPRGDKVKKGDVVCAGRRRLTCALESAQGLKGEEWARGAQASWRTPRRSGADQGTVRHSKDMRSRPRRRARRLLGPRRRRARQRDQIEMAQATIARPENLELSPSSPPSTACHQAQQRSGEQCLGVSTTPDV